MKKFILETLKYTKPELQCSKCPITFGDFDELLKHEKDCIGETDNVKISATN